MCSARAPVIIIAVHQITITHPYLPFFLSPINAIFLETPPWQKFLALGKAYDTGKREAIK